jgi:hypothetical protein
VGEVVVFVDVDRVVGTDDVVVGDPPLPAASWNKAMLSV